MKRRVSVISIESLAIGMVVFFLILAATATRGQAAALITGQSGATESSFVLHWTKDSRALEYHLGISTDKDEASSNATKHSITVPSTDNSYTFTGLQKGTKYYVALSYSYKESDTVKESTPGTVSASTIIGSITGLTQARWYANKEKVYVTWDEQTAATYEYVFMDQSGKTISSGKWYTNTYNHSISNKKCYCFKVKATAKVNGKSYDSGYSQTIYLFAQPRIKSSNFGSSFELRITDGKLKVKWNKVKYATGYNIYVSKSRDSGYVNVLTVKKKKTQATVKKFKGKKFKPKGTYYVYIEAVKNKNGVVSSSGINYVWQYKNGKVSQTYYHGKY